MLRQIDVSVTKNAHNGSYECTAVVDGSRVSKVYYGYTKREAVRLFTASVNAVSNMARLEHERKYQPKTGAKCGCKKGIERDNCPNCEGTGMVIDFRAIHKAREQREKFAYECQQCGKWNTGPACIDDGPGADDEKGCGETVNLKPIRL